MIRLHDGSTDILPYLDDQPDTITIRTDKFPPYAFATLKDKPGRMPFIAAFAVILLFAVFAGVLLKKRRKN